MSMSEVEFQRLLNSVQSVVAGVHQFLGARCLCGYETHLARGRTEHIVSEAIEAARPFLQPSPIRLTEAGPPLDIDRLRAVYEEMKSIEPPSSAGQNPSMEVHEVVCTTWGRWLRQRRTLREAIGDRLADWYLGEDKDGSER